MSAGYVPADELGRLLALDAEPRLRAAIVADACRINVLHMVATAGSGHIGTSFSSMDVLAWLHTEELAGDDLFFSSKGHDAPALYAVLIALGRLDFELLHQLRRLGGLPGHPDVATVPEVATNTGSLGMGISKARGFALAARHAGRRRRVFVLTGDGELQEGQFWESLGPTANRGLGEITVICDRNGIQSDTWTDQVSDLGDLAGKVAAFGWAVDTCDGNDMASLAAALERLDGAGDVPRFLIAETRKGAGVSFMEPHELPRSPASLYAYHSGAPSQEECERALAELRARVDERLSQAGAAPLAVTPGEAAVRTPPAGERLVAAYGEALVAEATGRPEVVALDADLVLDTGLVGFRDRFPARFFECGIAEQDMVSQAGAMALAGLRPVVHSFACFLTTRASEQMFNNATEGTRVVYVGSLAGLVPAGPGHSHQSVRDIALMSSLPGVSVLEPLDEPEAELCLRWILDHAPGPAYLRLVSVPWPLGFEPPRAPELVAGRGSEIRGGGDVLLVAAGPVAASQAFAACDLLAEQGIAAGLVTLPWLRGIDGSWLAELAAGRPLVTVDNHVVEGGLGAGVAVALEEARCGLALTRLGVDGVAACGTNAEALARHGLDAAGIAGSVRAALGAAVA